jgi:hypothetical protein
MMPLRGVQTMLGTDRDDTKTLKEVLRASLPRLEAKIAEIANGACDKDFGIILVSWDNLKRSVDATLTSMAREAAIKRAANSDREARYGQSGDVAQKPTDIRPVGGDPLRAFPAFAALRDKWGLRMTSFTDHVMHCVVRLEGESFDLMIGEDRGDDWFMIRPKGSSRDWWISEVLHEMGLWNYSREGVDHRKLARVLEQNLPAVLVHIAEKENYSGSA